VTRIAIVIPAYNESASIAGVISDLRRVAQERGLDLMPVVVNDCSKDNTGEIIDALPCVALHLPVNLGIGGAVQTGFRYAFDNGFDYAIQVDGDGQHPADEIPNLIEAAEKNNWDVTIGSRFLTGEGFQSTLMRRSGIRYFMRLNRLLTGITIHDTTSGFRVLNRRGLERVVYYYPDEYPEPEVLVMYARVGLRVGEVPVKMRERQGGVSSINMRRAIYYMGKVTLGTLFTRIRF
jgi:glycosyltransferase involved in cell wall biosynthesis